MSNTHDEQIPKSSLKLDFLAKGQIVPIWHIYSGATDEELDTIRRQSIEQLRKTVAEIKNTSAVNLANVKFVFEQ